MLDKIYQTINPKKILRVVEPTQKNQKYYVFVMERESVAFNQLFELKQLGCVEDIHVSLISNSTNNLLIEIFLK